MQLGAAGSTDKQEGTCARERTNQNRSLAEQQFQGRLLAGTGSAGHILQLRPDLLPFTLRGGEDHASEDDPRHMLQKCGGLADSWYLDDGDIMCQPLLVLPHLMAVDIGNAQIAAERTQLNSEVIYLVATLEEARPE